MATTMQNGQHLSSTKDERNKQTKDLADLVTLTGVKPRECRGFDGLPALALAFHCLMVEEGFDCLDKFIVVADRYMPHQGWNSSSEPSRVFYYMKKGLANSFKMEVQCNTADKKVLISVEEIYPQPLPPAGTNIQYLGLLIDKYIPDVKTLDQPGWRGVFKNEDLLRGYFDEYIASPLQEQAERDLQTPTLTMWSRLSNITTDVSAYFSMDRVGTVKVSIAVAAIVVGVSAYVWSLQRNRAATA